MCCTIWIPSSKTYISNMGELIAFAGRDKIVCDVADYAPDTDLFAPEFCLCPVNMDATAAALGFVLDDHDGDPMEMHFVSPPPQKGHADE